MPLSEGKGDEAQAVEEDAGEAQYCGYIGSAAEQVAPRTRLTSMMVRVGCLSPVNCPVRRGA